ncbi:SulP family inorganic anion transporter [Paraburkholderia rhizosphaerae]|uniref:MFS superfamily sulfate permease-like transporter n=1 Tax=Paraburkholderia rhizosphaerae TaxID=480658 RepID=A0A4R8KNP8_9BURK|nr:SulP family inorganic anion transporter [Paraburkholderia rhizosphaerae]TDY31221.1 MFS superfamily sulfate permease-like transporter [Paraburkholderia rhizosphaerae]
MKPANSLSQFPRDLFAGTVVFLVAMPLCLGIANASGVQPFAGLLSGIIGGLVVALLSGSQLSVSGPAAGLIVIVVEGIAGLGSFSAFLLAVLLSGLIQFGFGMLKAGRFAEYVPLSVVNGMLAAIGLLLVIKQTPLALGFANGGATVASGAGMLGTPFGWVSISACVVAMISLAMLASWETRAMRRFALVRAVPAPLAVVAVGIGLTLMLDLFAPEVAPPAQHRVALSSLGSLSAFTDALQLPDFAQWMNPDVWSLALTLAIVASLETLLSLEAVEQIDPRKRGAPRDRELKAQGIGNIMAGAIGALPITSVIVRSSANVHAGAQSRWSSFIHGALLLASVFALTSIINLIPLACLAAILIFTGFKLAKPALFVATFRQGVERFVPFIATIAGVLLTDLLMGILLGIACSFLLAVRANLRRPITIAQHDDHYLFSFRKDVSFLAKVKLKHHLRTLPDGATVIFDASRADYIDPDVREVIDRFVAQAPGRRMHVECRNMPIAEPTLPSLGVQRVWPMWVRSGRAVELKGLRQPE